MVDFPVSSHSLRNRLRMRQVLLLRALGEFGHLRRSAEHLGMTQPAATKLLQDLEQVLGVPLFERSRRGMSPTWYGDAMIRFANSLLSELDTAHQEISALAAGAAGVVTVGIMTSTYSEVVPQALLNLLERAPAVQVSLMEGTHEMLMTALKRGDLDMALGRIMGGRALDDLEVEVLYKDDFVVVCGPEHPLARAGSVDPAELKGYRWILPHSTTPLRQRVEILLTELTGDRPQHAVECASLLTNLSLLQQSTMLTVMAADVVHRFAEFGLVQIVPLKISSVQGPVALIRRSQRQPSPVVAAFIEELRKAAATTLLNQQTAQLHLPV